MNVTVTAGRLGSGQRDADAAPSTALQLLGVAAGPCAWAVQLVVNYAIAAYPCFHEHVARVAIMPGWEGSWMWVLVVNIAAVAATLAAFAIGLRAWRWSQRQNMSEERHGRIVGRTRALGVAALLFGAIFLLASLFTSIAILGTPQCAV